MNTKFKLLIFPLCIFLTASCKKSTLPKPKGYLRLNYPKATYKTTDTHLNFSFKKNDIAKVITSTTHSDGTTDISVKYPLMKATIYLTYKKIVDDNIYTLLRDAQNLTYKHSIKADEIEQISYSDEKNKIFGMFSEIGGNVASQAQFYVTDSINHFLTGSLYFFAKPNYDSIYPASEYLKKDIIYIMETIRWKEKFYR